MDPILIDERLSPCLVGVAKGRGYVALHGAWINREGTDDRALAMLAAERDYTIVTKQSPRLPTDLCRTGGA